MWRLLIHSLARIPAPGIFWHQIPLECAGIKACQQKQILASAGALLTTNRVRGSSQLSSRMRATIVAIASSYEQIQRRRQHALEGWMITRYQPGSGDWQGCGYMFHSIRLLATS